MELKIQVVRCIGKYPNKQILGCLPLEHQGKIILNKYGNFTLIDNTLALSENKTYTVEIKEIDSKYGKQYQLISVPSFSMESIDDITDEMELELLSEITTGAIIDSIHNAYPNYLRLILQGRQDEIDLNKIKGVKDYRHNLYCRLINEKFKYYHILDKNKQYKLELKDCKSLSSIYPTVEEINEHLQANPYYCLIYICRWNFLKADKIIMECREDLVNSDIRAEFAMMYLLQQNEYNGHTYIDARELGSQMLGFGKEVVGKLKSVAIESDLIHYDKDKNTLALSDTYLAECTIAEFVKNKVATSTKLDWDWQKFKEIKDGVMTDEQQNVLKMFCENSLLVLDSASGCVDKDTEFFNGFGWKKISEYNEKDMVLQFNNDRTASLVEPQKYHKIPCDKMWHIKTKYGIDQMLSDEHRVIYTREGQTKCTDQLRELTLKEVREIHKNNKCGFSGRIITTFDYGGKGIDLTNEEIRVMCAVICDGSFYNNIKEYNGSYMRCRFHIKKDRKKERLRKLFKEANIEWREHISSAKDYIDFYIDAPLREKEFNSSWYSCSKEQLEVICDEVIFWDGSVNKTKNGITRKRFSTSVKATADFIQFAFSSCGYRARVIERDRVGHIKKGTNYIQKSLEYIVSITKRNLCSFVGDKNNKPHFNETQTKDGYKYCFTVSSGMLVLRREGNIFITGNCGKTSTVKGILDMCDEYDFTYCNLAFTGKASSRLKEQINRPTSTIHRKTLGGEIWEDVLIIDEYSMLSLDLLMMVIKSITNDNIRVLFVGDSLQIPNLGLGTFAKDVLSIDYIPKCELTHCFRFADGGASYVSALTRSGEFYLTDEQCEQNHIVLGKNKDYEFHKWNGDITQVIDIYMELIDRGVKPQDICVLTPMNKYEYGATNINNLIQAEINPPKPKDVIMKSKHNDIDVALRVNDLVMNIKNDYNAINADSYEIMEWEDGVSEEDLPTTSIFNGQIGKVLSIDNKVLKAQIDDEIIVFNKTKCYNLLLSYSTNPFKFQGSSAKYIINLVIPQHTKMLNRQLLYTAQTRQEVKLIEIGDIGAIKNSIQTLGGKDKRSLLKELLTKENV